MAVVSPSSDAASGVQGVPPSPPPRGPQCREAHLKVDVHTRSRRQLSNWRHRWNAARPGGGTRGRSRTHPHESIRQTVLYLDSQVPRNSSANARCGGEVTRAERPWGTPERSAWFGVCCGTAGPCPSVPSSFPTGTYFRALQAKAPARVAVQTPRKRIPSSSHTNTFLIWFNLQLKLGPFQSI